MIKEFAEAVKTFTPSQWGVMATIICGTIGSWAWVNNHFAEKSTTEKILDHLISIDSKLTAVITTQHSDAEVKIINETAAELEKHLKKYKNISDKK